MQKNVHYKKILLFSYICCEIIIIIYASVLQALDSLGAIIVATCSAYHC